LDPEKTAESTVGAPTVLVLREVGAFFAKFSLTNVSLVVKSRGVPTAACTAATTAGRTCFTNISTFIEDEGSPENVSMLGKLVFVVKIF
jgi:hypothetical protein